MHAKAEAGMGRVGWLEWIGMEARDSLNVGGEFSMGL